MVLVFHGADTFRSRQKLREVLEKFRRDVDPQGYNITRLDGNTARCGDIVSALTASAFMARKRLILVEHLSEMDFKKEEEVVLVEATEKALTAEVVFVVWEEELNKTAWKQPVFAVLKTSPYVVEFASLDAGQVLGIMRQKLDATGVQLDSQAWGYLSMAIEDDVYRASGESDKLVAFAQAQGKTLLTLADIKPLIAGGLRDDVFALVDAVTQGNRRQSLSLLHDQLQSGSHSLELTSLLVRQYRVLQQVMDGLQQGLSPDRIASVYKMHPFVAKKMAGQARRMNSRLVRQAYDVLTALDRDLKGSGLPPDLLISAAVSRLGQT